MELEALSACSRRGSETADNRVQKFPRPASQGIHCFRRILSPHKGLRDVLTAQRNRAAVLGDQTEHRIVVGLTVAGSASRPLAGVAVPDQLVRAASFRAFNIQAR
jgi:hypothetical protein